MMTILSIRDVSNTLAYAGTAPIALALPKEQLPSVAKKWATFFGRVKPSRFDVDYYQSVVGDRLPHVTAAQVYQGAVGNAILERLYLLRCYRKGGWDPDVRVLGTERITETLDLGKGAILWAAPFRFSNLVTKIVCAREGFEVEHLSRFSHPGSESAIGCALLNPIRTNIEGRYLAKRIVIGRDKRVDGLSTLDVLASRLQENRLISINVGNDGRQVKTLPLLDGEIRLATAPGHLSLKTSAPILPVFTVYEGAGKFTMTIGPQLKAGAQTNPNARIDEMFSDFSDRLTDYLLKYPDQFLWTMFSY